MQDFRNNLYQSYVSKFKQPENSLRDAKEQGDWQYFDRKHFKFLQKLNHDDAILDVGCGSGMLMAYLVAKGFRRVEGVDISAEQIELAVAKNLKAQCVDVFSFLESKRGAFQAIVAIDFVEHFKKDELLRLFSLLFRALKADGTLLIQTPNGQGLLSSQVIYGDLTHCTIFTPESLRQALRPNGFEDIIFEETGPVSKNLKGLLRLVLWRGIRLAGNFVRLIEAGKRQDVWTENFICVCRKHDKG